MANLPTPPVDYDGPKQPTSIAGLLTQPTNVMLGGPPPIYTRNPLKTPDQDQLFREAAVGYPG